MQDVITQYTIYCIPVSLTTRYYVNTTDCIHITHQIDLFDSFYTDIIGSGAAAKWARLRRKLLPQNYI